MGPWRLSSFRICIQYCARCTLLDRSPKFFIFLFREFLFMQIRPKEKIYKTSVFIRLWSVAIDCMCLWMRRPAHISWTFNSISPNMMNPEPNIIYMYRPIRVNLNVSFNFVEIIWDQHSVGVGITTHCTKNTWKGTFISNLFCALRIWFRRLFCTLFTSSKSLSFSFRIQYFRWLLFISLINATIICSAVLTDTHTFECYDFNSQLKKYLLMLNVLHSYILAKRIRVLSFTLASWRLKREKNLLLPLLLLLTLTSYSCIYFLLFASRVIFRSSCAPLLWHLNKNICMCGQHACRHYRIAQYCSDPVTHFFPFFVFSSTHTHTQHTVNRVNILDETNTYNLFRFNDRTR